MTKFLIVYDQINNTIEVNLAAIKEIFDKDDIFSRCKLSNQVTELDLNWCDACYAIRPSSINALRIAKTLKSSNRFFVSLFDDDLLNISKTSSLYWRVKYMTRCLRLSDYVVTGNPEIIKAYKEISPESHFVLSKAYVQNKDILPVQDVSDKIKLVYCAGRDHTELFETFILPSLDDVLALDKNIELHLMGVEPNLANVSHRVQIIIHPTRTYEEYKDFMREGHFDIGLAPLHDDTFSNRKYFRKYIDYAEFGVLGLYSNCMPYTFVVKDGFNGIMVENSVQAWSEALSKAVKNISSLKALVNNSQDHLRADFSLDAVKRAFWNELGDILNTKRNEIEVSFNCGLFTKVVYGYLVNYHRLKAHVISDGVWGTIRQLIAR